MSNYIKKTREGEFNPFVRAPLRRANPNADYEEIARSPITNIESLFKSDSILSKLDSRQKNFSDVTGVSCIMVARINEEVFRDKVTIKGEKGNFFVVEIDGTDYSVSKTCVLFVIE